jgi:hypothetical protein
MKKLKERNIKLDEQEFPPYRWNNEKPVPIGFIIPEEDKWVHIISELAKLLRTTPRTSVVYDNPNPDQVVISDTLANELANKLENLLKGE